MIIKTYFIENMNEIIKKKTCPSVVLKDIRKIIGEMSVFLNLFFNFVLLFI